MYKARQIIFQLYLQLKQLQPKKLLQKLPNKSSKGREIGHLSVNRESNMAAGWMIYLCPPTNIYHYTSEPEAEERLGWV